MSEQVNKTVKSAINTAPLALEGVASGVLLMVLPLLLIGTAIGLGLILIKTPVKMLGGLD